MWTAGLSTAGGFAYKYGMKFFDKIGKAAKKRIKNKAYQSKRRKAFRDEIAEANASVDDMLPKFKKKSLYEKAIDKLRKTLYLPDARPEDFGNSMIQEAMHAIETGQPIAIPYEPVPQRQGRLVQLNLQGDPAMEYTDPFGNTRYFEGEYI